MPHVRFFYPAQQKKNDKNCRGISWFPSLSSYCLKLAGKMSRKSQSGRGGGEKDDSRFPPLPPLESQISTNKHISLISLPSKEERNFFLFYPPFLFSFPAEAASLSARHGSFNISSPSLKAPHQRGGEIFSPFPPTLSLSAR